MPSLLAALLVSTTLVATAHADDAPPTGAPAATPVGAPVDGANAIKVALPQPHRVGIAVNPPFRWIGDSKAFGASLYVALGRHHVVRGNVARYAYGDMLATETSYDGDTTDVGASYMYFPRRAFDGFVVEAGFVYRHEDGVGHGPFWDDTTENTTLYGGRAMVGWSFLLEDRVFLSVQAGASVGKKTGTEELCSTGCMDYGDDPDVTRISETQVSPEVMFRIGVAL
jgi:hypothetical protein